MGHAEDDFLKAKIAAALDDLLQRRDQCLAAIKAETLGALVFDIDELLETFGLDQLLQDCLLAHRGEFNRLVRPFDALLDPALFFRVRHVHEFNAERRAIGALKDRHHLAHGRVF